MINVTKELAPTRRAHIRDYVINSGSARVDEICREFNASPATVRRDLEALEQSGQVRRVHGGAVRIESKIEEKLFDDKTFIASAEKTRIAEFAASLIKDGDTVYLDGGSTVLELAKQLVNRTKVTVVTNSIRAAGELSNHGPNLILIGGELRRLSQTLVGPLTLSLLEQLHIDISFMGTMGVSIEEGLTTSDSGEAFTKKLAMKRARKVVLLSDSSKCGQNSFAKAGNIQDVHVFVTDSNLPSEFEKELNNRSIQVVTV